MKKFQNLIDKFCPGVITRYNQGSDELFVVTNRQSGYSSMLDENDNPSPDLRIVLLDAQGDFDERYITADKELEEYYEIINTDFVEHSQIAEALKLIQEKSLKWFREQNAKKELQSKCDLCYYDQDFTSRRCDSCFEDILNGGQ